MTVLLKKAWIFSTDGPSEVTDFIWRQDWRRFHRCTPVHKQNEIGGEVSGTALFPAWCFPDGKQQETGGDGEESFRLQAGHPAGCFSLLILLNFASIFLLQRIQSFAHKENFILVYLITEISQISDKINSNICLMLNVYKTFYQTVKYGW